MVALSLILAAAAPRNLAIVDVNVIDVRAGAVRNHQTILTSLDRIVWVGDAKKARIPRGTTRIDGRGRYAIPGLWDMHAHAFDRDSMALFTANGVTVGGTPADCVRLALRALDLRPAWVLSGVNAGGNMGQDIVISGTVAAAREAAYHGLRAMALSHYLIRDLAVDWLRVGEWAGELMRELSGAALADGEFWNVNLPHHPPGTLGLPERLPCHPARSPLNVSYAPTEHGHVYTASYAERPQDPGSDVEVCFSGRVAVSRLRIG
mgnify:CR=1 FL=1